MFEDKLTARWIGRTAKRTEANVTATASRNGQKRILLKKRRETDRSECYSNSVAKRTEANFTATASRNGQKRMLQQQRRETDRSECYSNSVAKRTEANITEEASPFAHSPLRYDRMRWCLPGFITEPQTFRKYSLRKLRKTKMFIICAKLLLITIISFRVVLNQNIRSLQTAPLSSLNSWFYCAESFHSPVTFYHFLFCLQFLKACFEDQSETGYTGRVRRRALTLYCLIR